jgi:hypothetical protein
MKQLLSSWLRTPSLSKCLSPISFNDILRMIQTFKLSTYNPLPTLFATPAFIITDSTHGSLHLSFASVTPSIEGANLLFFSSSSWLAFPRCFFDHSTFTLIAQFEFHRGIGSLSFAFLYHQRSKGEVEIISMFSSFLDLSYQTQALLLRSRSTRLGPPKHFPQLLLPWPSSFNSVYLSYGKVSVVSPRYTHIYSSTTRAPFYT